MPRPVGRRAEIHETFIRHVAERGYEATNLGDIADELGMSKGTIVHHFGTKAQMLRELEENYMRQQLDALDEMWEVLLKPQERIAAMLFISTQLQLVARDATVATQREIVQLADDPEMHEVRKIRREVQQRTIDELAKGIESGAFRAIDPQLAAMQLFGSLQWMWVWYDPEGRAKPDTVASAFADIFLSGILTNRAAAKALADPQGTVAKAVRAALKPATPAEAPAASTPRSA